MFYWTCVTNVLNCLQTCLLVLWINGERKSIEKSLFFISLKQAKKNPYIKNYYYYYFWKKKMGGKNEWNPIFVTIFSLSLPYGLKVSCIWVCIFAHSCYWYCDACTRSKHLTTAHRLDEGKKNNNEQRKRIMGKKVNEKRKYCIRW